MRCGGDAMQEWRMTASKNTDSGAVEEADEEGGWREKVVAAGTEFAWPYVVEKVVWARSMGE